jgi:two-component system LytT family response regulator
LQFKNPSGVKSGGFFFIPNVRVLIIKNGKTYCIANKPLATNIKNIISVNILLPFHNKKRNFVCMKKYSAIIVDNEKNLREALAVMLAANCPEIHVCGTAASAAEGRELLKTEDVDFIFLDISMPEEDGFAFLRSIPKEKYGIIFVTSYEEYALRAIKASAIDYLLKPVDPKELCEAVAKAIHYFEVRKHKPGAGEIYQESLENLNHHYYSEEKVIQKITIPEQFGFKVVNVKEVMYLKAESNYTTLYFTGGNKIVATRSLGEFEKIINDPVFYRIHKSTIINLNYLRGYSSYEGNYAEMADGELLPVSRRKMNDFREVLRRYAKNFE